MKIKLYDLGFRIALYGTALTLFWIGLFKFTPTEAEGIKGLIEESPFMSWLYSVGSVQQISNFIGTFEIITALLLITYPKFPKASFVGGILNTVIFITTLSFLFTTTGMFRVVDGIFVPTAGQFILKDLAMLGVGLIVMSESRERI